jgi:hypothetical protein
MDVQDEEEAYEEALCHHEQLLTYRFVFLILSDFHGRMRRT